VAIDPTSSALSSGFVPAFESNAALSAVAAKIPKLRALAEKIFGGNVNVELEGDPEIEDVQYVVLTVDSHGTIEEIGRRHDEWYGASYRILGSVSECERVQLVVNVIE